MLFGAVTIRPPWKILHRDQTHSCPREKRLLSGFRAPLKPLEPSQHYGVEGDLMGSPIMPRDARFVANGRNYELTTVVQWKNSTDQTYSCPRDLHFSASRRGPIEDPPLKPTIHHSTIELRPSNILGTLN